MFAWISEGGEEPKIPAFGFCCCRELRLKPLDLGLQCGNPLVKFGQRRVVASTRYRARHSLSLTPLTLQKRYLLTQTEYLTQQRVFSCPRCGEILANVVKLSHCLGATFTCCVIGTTLVLVR